MPKLSESDLLAYNIGLVTLKYNDVQYWFFAIFQTLMHDALYLAHPTFFSIKSDRGQRDMLRHLAEERLSKHPAFLKSLGAFIERANQLGGRRNDALHAMWLYGVEGSKPEVSFPFHNRLKGKDTEQEIKALYADLNALELALYPFYEKVRDTLQRESKAHLYALAARAFSEGLRPPDRDPDPKAIDQQSSRKGRRPPRDRQTDTP